MERNLARRPDAMHHSKTYKRNSVQLTRHRACLHGGGGHKTGEVTFDESLHLPCKRDQIKMRDLWTGGLPHLSGLPHLPGVPYLHVNRPIDINRGKTQPSKSFFFAKGEIYRAVTKGFYRGFIRLPGAWLFGFFHKKQMENLTTRIS